MENNQQTYNAKNILKTAIVDMMANMMAWAWETVTSKISSSLSSRFEEVLLNNFF